MPDASRLSLTRDRTLLLTAAGGSLLISCWLILSNDVINRDGVRYVAAAEAIAAGNLQGAFDAFPWPFHAALMAAVHVVTGLSAEMSGYLLIPPLHLLVVFAFLAILREMGGTKPVLWAGLALVLLHPELNDTLPSILRDQGYWAFWLLGLLHFIRYLKRRRWRDAVLWTLWTALALLFRIEGLVFLLLMPLALLASSGERWKARLFSAARIYAPAACLAGLMLASAVMLGRDAIMLDEGRLLEPLQRVQNIWVGITDRITSHGWELGKTLLPRYSRNHGPAAMWVVLVYIAAIESFRAVNWLYVALAVAGGFVRRLRPDARILPVIWWAMAINFMLIGGFVLSEFYLSMRYAAGLGLVVMLLASFGLASLWQNEKERCWTSRTNRLAYPAAVTALVIVGASGLISIGPRKDHERAAGAWVREHVPMEDSVFFDDMRLGYYAGRPYERGTNHSWPLVRSLLRKGEHHEYEVLVLRFSRRWPEQFTLATKLIGSEPIQQFENNRGDFVAVFRPEREEP